MLNVRLKFLVDHLGKESGTPWISFIDLLLGRHQFTIGRAIQRAKNLTAVGCPS